MGEISLISVSYEWGKKRTSKIWKISFYFYKILTFYSAKTQSLTVNNAHPQVLPACTSSHGTSCRLSMRAGKPCWPFFSETTTDQSLQIHVELSWTHTATLFSILDLKGHWRQGRLMLVTAELKEQLSLATEVKFRDKKTDISLEWMGTCLPRNGLFVVRWLFLVGSSVLFLVTPFSIF